MILNLSELTDEPLHAQLSRQIRAKILSLDLASEDPLPSIRALARDLQISVITTKRAYEELEREGMLNSVGGKGTFVAAQNPEFLREKKMKTVEEKLSEAVDHARLLGVSPEELTEMMRLLYGEGD